MTIPITEVQIEIPLSNELLAPLVNQLKARLGLTQISVSTIH